MKELNPKTQSLIDNYLELKERFKKAHKEHYRLIKELKKKGYTYKELAYYCKKSASRIIQIVFGL